MTEPQSDEYARFERFARKVVNTPKPSVATRAADEPAAERSEREEDSSDSD